MSNGKNPIFENQMVGHLSLDQPAGYCICVKGELSENWSDRLGGMAISQQVRDDGAVISILDGQLRDQAALFGVLVGLYNMRLPLVSVELLEAAGKEDSIIKVRVEQCDDYIEFIVTGIYELSSAIEKFPLVIMTCRQTGLSKALVDYRRLAGEILVTEELLYAYRAGGFYKEHLSSGGQPLKIAFVGNKKLPHKGGEAIGKTHGAEILVTSDYQEAVDWLCSEI